MSRTKRKNGNRIETAIQQVAYGKPPMFYGMFTIGEAARMAKMSKPTVSKYIEILKEAGLVIEHERDMRYCLKTTPRTLQYTGAKLEGI